MGDSTLLPLVVSAFGGAFLALVGEGFFKKWADARTAKALAAALWEELSATYIGQRDAVSLRMGTPLRIGRANREYAVRSRDSLENVPVYVYTGPSAFGSDSSEASEGSNGWGCVPRKGHQAGIECAKREACEPRGSTRGSVGAVGISARRER